MFIFMDETAKDRKAARRRRGWVETLLAAMNINGFIPAACI
jgi:hypothetical protein